MSDKVFIALQNNEEARPIIEAILDDNPHAVLHEFPAMVKIDAPDLFLKIQLSTTFALRDDSPDAHLYFNDTGVTCSPLVNTSGRISMTVFDSDKISVDMQVNHAPPVGQYCPGVIRGCLIQRVECKGKTTMTVLP